MNSLKELDKETLVEITEKIVQKMLNEKEDMSTFWNSSLCQKMIEDMKKVNEGFDAEEFAYFPQKVKSRFGWEELLDNDIKQFINVMADHELGVDKKKDIQEDEDCSFENFKVIKKGILVFVMFGQGTAISLSPQK